MQFTGDLNKPYVKCTHIGSWQDYVCSKTLIDVCAALENLGHLSAVQLGPDIASGSAGTAPVCAGKLFSVSPVLSSNVINVLCGYCQMTALDRKYSSGFPGPKLSTGRCDPLVLPDSFLRNIVLDLMNPTGEQTNAPSIAAQQGML